MWYKRDFAEMIMFEDGGLSRRPGDDDLGRESMGDVELAGWAARLVVQLGDITGACLLR